MSESEANILVVDDTPENLHFLVRILKEKGYHVRPAANGVRALAGVEAEAPNLILLDIRMPDMSGYDICEKLKADSRFCDIPVIFISALNEVFDKVRAFSLGAVDYITKPFHAEEVLARVETHLTLCQLQKQLRTQNKQLRELNEKLEQKVEERTADLGQSNKRLKFELDVNSALAEVSEELLSSGYDTDSIVNHILEYAKKLTGSEHGYVSAIDPKTLDNVIHTFTETDAGQCKVKNWRPIFPLNADGKYNGLWGHSLNTLEPFYANKPEHHLASEGLPEGHIPLHRFLSVPVIIENKPAGQIALANPKNDYGEKDLRIIERLAGLYGLALQRRQYECDKEKLQAQLYQAQKMEAIGILAGGIAHDFNNILFPIFGYLEMMMYDTPEDAPHYGSLNKVFSAAKRAQELVGQILTFSRQGSREVRPLKVQLVIKEVFKLIQNTLPSTIDFCQDIDDNCGPVLADPTQIHQTIMNLITNAYHAMQESGGRLEVSLTEINHGTNDLKGLNMKPGPYVCLTVADTGAGMEKKVTERIFEPYFTTKEKGKGTGLGLAVVHGIVKNCGGDIHVYSEPGQGSIFHVYLPRIDTDSDLQRVKTESIPRGGNERILLVDDEEEIVEMEKAMLERLGYQVSSVISSVKALDVFRRDPDQFDLVITDLTMPNMTGMQLSKKLLAIRPDIPIILCTGFSEQIHGKTATEMGILAYLKKPVLRSDLAETIRSVLE